MASDTNTARDKIPADAAAEPHTWWLWRRVDPASAERHLSPIVLRILAVNVMALAILVGSLLYLGRYQDKIIATELNSLLMQSRIIASAVVEGAIVIDENDRSILSPLLSRLMVRRLAETTETRTRLFDSDKTLLADSRILLGAKIRQAESRQAEDEKRTAWTARFTGAVFGVMDFIHERRSYPLYEEQEIQRADHYDIARRALDGETATQVWSASKGGLILAVAVPVQHYKNVLGAVMMTRTNNAVDKAIYAVRIDILRIFFITLFITILLSLYLARAIAQPIRLLAMAAERLRHGQMQIVGLVGMSKLLTRDVIPDLTKRNDEIGDLSGALRDLTSALAHRIGAIENFAADVAHEIKNPLTSLRSAVETVERIQDPERKKKLMAVIRDDVDRLDRLISDIASASRIDAELSRDEMTRVDINRMLETLADFYHQVPAAGASKARLVLDPLPQGLVAEGVEARLVQVLRNLIDNALSFSPADGVVKLAASHVGRFIQIAVEDNGPGIPENKLEAIFDRFYTERPKSEKFGTHSGLGLSISKQIIEGHRGRIWAENRHDDGGKITGARFLVMLPDANM